MPRASRAEWEKRVRRWRDSGLSAREFAAETGLSAATLANWRWKLNNQPSTDDVAAAQDAAALDEVVHEAVRFVELKPAAAARTTTAVSVPAMLELVLHHDVRVRVPSDFDEAALTRLVRAVEAAR